MKLSKLAPALALTAMLSMASSINLHAEDKACAPSKSCDSKEKSSCSTMKDKCDPCGSVEKLDLTADQKEKVKAIKESKESEFDKIKADAKEKASAVMEDMEKEVRKILTPEQIAKLDAMKSEKASDKKAE